MSRSHKFSVLLAVLVSLCLVASTAFAQDDDGKPTALEAGTHALSFGFPGGGSAGWGGQLSGMPTFAYFHNFDPQFQAGAGAIVMYDDDIAFEITPTGKFFLSTTEQVVPYLFGSVDLSYDGNDFDVGIGAGFGAEYFWIPQFSIGANFGIALLDRTGADFTTFVSGMNANFYF